MKCTLDIEANGLHNPTKIWVVVCKDYDTEDYYIFRRITEDETERQRFREFVTNVNCWIGHNICAYDLPVLSNLVGLDWKPNQCYDTFILSKLINYSRTGGHSIESYGLEFGLEKLEFSDWSKYSPEMEEYCIRDVNISEKIYNKYLKYINNPKHDRGIRLEHNFQSIVNDLRTNGFHFNVDKAKELLQEVNTQLKELDTEIEKAFPPKLKLIKEVNPTYTKHGTLHKKDFRFAKNGDLSEYNGGPFCRCEWENFNPASHKQIIEVLSSAGWKPLNKTKTHTITERELNTNKFKKTLDKDKKIWYNTRLDYLKKYGWRINEKNLNTLPDTAPAPARTLAQRILLEARRRTLTEWLGLVKADGRIHCDFQGIGAWTQRMSHQNPNVANIPTGVKLYGDVMRSLWNVPEDKLLVGVDAEGIQLRIFAHYIDSPEFTDALVRGRKDDKSDPHSLNQRILGDVCSSRQVAKRFIYALLLGAGINKLAEILSCTVEQARQALGNILSRYRGFAHLKETIIPRDAKRAWFEGLDGRSVRVPGNSTGDRRHLCMSGYLQNGEAIIMKLACLKWYEDLTKLRIPFKIVNFVHDEWQTEIPNDMDLALEVAKIQANSLRIVGEELDLNCSLAGSFWSDDHHRYTIGNNWSITH